MCVYLGHTSLSELVKINMKLPSGFHHLTDSPSIVLLKGCTITENQLLMFLGHLQSGAGHLPTFF